MTVHVRYTFWYISFPSSAKQQREMTSFKFFFWRTGTHEGEFFFSFWTWAPSLRIQFPDSSKAHRMKMNNISSKPEMAEVRACADVLPRCRYRPIYTPGWRDTMRGNVRCLRKQHDGRDLGLEPPTFKSKVQHANHYTTAPTRHLHGNV